MMGNKSKEGILDCTLNVYYTPTQASHALHILFGRTIIWRRSQNASGHCASVSTHTNSALHAQSFFQDRLLSSIEPGPHADIYAQCHRETHTNGKQVGHKLS